MPWHTSPGAAGAFPPQQIAKWREVIHSPPEARGVPASRWTLRSLRDTLEGWSSLSLSGAWRRLKAARLCYKRGREYVHSPDPEYIAKRDFAQACVDQARTEPERIVTCYLDEFSFYRQPTVAQDWHAVGHMQPLARRSHRSNRYHRIIGALNAVTGHVNYRMAARTDVPLICGFLRDLRLEYPEAEHFYVVMDNWYNVHNHADVQQTACEEGIELVYLPTYAPWLNPIEKLWRKAYQEVLHLHRYSDRWPQLKDRMASFMDQFRGGSPHLLRYVGLLPA